MIIEEGVKEIDSSAFRFCFDLQELHIPASVHVINAHINSYQDGLRHIFFHGMDTSIDDSNGGDWDRVTMHVRSGSEAEQYANEHNIKYEIMGE